MATQFAVDLIFKAQTSALKQVSNQLQGVDRTADKLKGKNPFDGVERGANRAAAATKNAGRQAELAAAGFNKLGKAVGGLVSAYAILQAGKFVIGKTAELETQTKSIEVLTGSLEKTRDIISELQSFAAVTPFTSSDLIETAKRLSAFGIETEKLVDTTKRLGDIAGATGARLGELATAYGQVQAKGRLQGEELLQFQERGVDLQGELQRMYKLSGEEFKKALEKGLIPAKAVTVAVENLTKAGGKYANGAIAQSETLAGKFSTLVDGIENIARSIGTILTPAIRGVLGIAIDAVNQINSLLETQKLLFGFGGALSSKKRAQLFNSVDADAQKLAKLRYDGGRSGKFDSGEFTSIKEQLFRDQLRKFGYDNQLLTPPKPKPVAGGDSTPPPLLGGDDDEKKKKGKGKKEKEAKDRSAELADLQANVQLKQQLLGLEQQLQIAKLAGSKEAEFDLEFQKRLLEGQARIAEITRNETDEKIRAQKIEEARLDTLSDLRELTFGMQQLDQDRRNQIEDMVQDLNDQTALAAIINDEVRKALELEQKLARLRKENPWITDEQLERLRAANKELDEATKKTEALKAQQQRLDDLYSGIGSTIANGVGGAIDAVADNVDNLGEALKGLAADILKAVGQMLIFYGLAQAFGALGGGDQRGVFSYLSKAFGGSFAGGGYTGDGPRAGGLDGKGGYLAMLHPQEMVTDLFGQNRDALKTAAKGMGGNGMELEDDPAMSALAANRAVLNQYTLASGVSDNRAAIEQQAIAETRSAMATQAPAMQVSASPVTLNVTATQIADEQWVKVDDMQRALAETRNDAIKRGSELGARRAVGQLQNSVKARKQVGLS